jgi:hypothetical protein
VGGITRRVGFAVEVIRIKGLHSGKDLFILFVGKMRVCTLSMPWVKAVVPNHGQTFGWESALILEDVVKILRSLLRQIITVEGMMDLLHRVPRKA